MIYAQVHADRGNQVADQITGRPPTALIVILPDPELPEDDTRPPLLA